MGVSIHGEIILLVVAFPAVFFDAADQCGIQVLKRLFSCQGADDVCGVFVPHRNEVEFSKISSDLPVNVIAPQLIQSGIAKGRRIGQKDPGVIVFSEFE